MKHRFIRGFTLIELMIVVAIIGILSAVAVPAYQEYLTRGQVHEAVQLLSSAKAPLAEYFADKAVWPTIDEAMGNTSGKYTDSISISGTPISTGPAPSITLQATIRMSGVNNNIAGRTLLLQTSDGGKNWRCMPGGTLPIHHRYLPAACR